MNDTTTDIPTRDQGYTLRLFYAGDEPNSSRARANLQVYIRKRFDDSFSWEEIDVLETPAIALQENILVTPTLEIFAAGSSSRVLVFGSLDNKDILDSILPLVDDHARQR